MHASCLHVCTTICFWVSTEKRDLLVISMRMICKSLRWLGMSSSLSSEQINCLWASPSSLGALTCHSAHVSSSSDTCTPTATLTFFCNTQAWFCSLTAKLRVGFVSVASPRVAFGVRAYMQPSLLSAQQLRPRAPNHFLDGSAMGQEQLQHGCTQLFHVYISIHTTVWVHHTQGACVQVDACMKKRMTAAPAGPAAPRAPLEVAVGPGLGDLAALRVATASALASTMTAAGAYRINTACRTELFASASRYRYLPRLCTCCSLPSTRWPLLRRERLRRELRRLAARLHVTFVTHSRRRVSVQIVSYLRRLTIALRLRRLTTALRRRRPGERKIFTRLILKDLFFETFLAVLHVSLPTLVSTFIRVGSAKADRWSSLESCEAVCRHVYVHTCSLWQSWAIRNET